MLLSMGLFSSSYMMCDRCVVNAKCGRFVPGCECVFEREMFDKIVLELVEEYSLDGFADKIMVERAAMYLIRISRAEAYEAKVGVSEKSAFWGAYVGKLDNIVKGACFVIWLLAGENGCRLRRVRGCL